MRILHTISSADPKGGGPIEGIKQLAEINRQNGQHIELATLDDPTSKFLQEFAFPVHALGPASLSYRYSPRFYPWMRDNAGKYDIIIVNGIWQYNSFATWRALHKSSTPYVVFTHGMLDPWFKRTYPMKHIKKWLYWPWGEYRVLRDASAVLFTCEEERLLARQSFALYAAQERTVNYGTSMPSGDPEVQKGQFLNRFPSLEGKRLALFMGRIHVKKGCDLAIKAFAATLASDPEWHLVMAGPDQSSWKTELNAIALELGMADRVTWTGMISGDVKTGAIRSSEFLFLPSHQENFGIVVAEALACGTPVLISNKVNIWREVQRAGAGLVADDDLPGSTSLLESWKQLPQLSRAEMRRRASACFSEQFEIHKASATLLGVLREIVNAKHPTR